jgi:hypothetical protein
MDAALKSAGGKLIVVGVLFMPLAPLAGGLVESAAIRHAGSLATSFGAAIFTVGCIQVARAKGQPWWLGLLGILNCVGLAVLWFAVPDKHPTSR